MKSAMLTSRGIKGLSIQIEPKPIRPKKWATVKLFASSINRVDLYMRDNGNGIKHSLPLILGVDGIVEVVEVGKNSNWGQSNIIPCRILFCLQILHLG
ncbi:MAG: hypothetical protein COA59_13615 [Colwellia sp.]|nr:MAG: hypothetical protein COA59_13615 [Colwellia sp.]